VIDQGENCQGRPRQVQQHLEGGRGRQRLCHRLGPPAGPVLGRAEERALVYPLSLEELELALQALHQKIVVPSKLLYTVLVQRLSELTVLRKDSIMDKFDYG
jgi:hypothetical protein